MLHTEEAGSGYVYVCGCKDLGEDGQLAVHGAAHAGQGGSAVMVQDCVGVVELSAPGMQQCMQRL